MVIKERFKSEFKLHALKMAKDARIPFEVHLITDHTASSMIPLITSLVSHPRKNQIRTIFYEPEELRIQNLLQTPLNRTLPEVGQNNLIVRYGAKHNIPVYLLRTSQIRRDLTFLAGQTDFNNGIHLGIFLYSSFNTVLDWANGRKENGGV